MVNSVKRWGEYKGNQALNIELNNGKLISDLHNCIFNGAVAVNVREESPEEIGVEE